MNTIQPTLADNDTETMQVLENICSKSDVARAYTLFSKRKDYAIFTEAGTGSRLKIYISDIMLVNAGIAEKEHIELVLENGEKHTVINYPLNTLLEVASKLVQVNKNQLVSIDAVNEIRHNLITLKGLFKNKPAYICLHPDFLSSFREKLFYR